MIRIPHYTAKRQYPPFDGFDYQIALFDVYNSIVSGKSRVLFRGVISSMRAFGLCDTIDVLCYGVCFFWDLFLDCF